MKRNNKNSIIVLVLILLVGIGIGYAVINTTLNINGKSSISKNSWDIHFDNIKIKDGSVEAVKVPIVENSTTVDFEVNLNLPWDFYEFTVDVVNNGTIDAIIESITKNPDLSTAQQKYLNYVIEYQNGEQITTKQLVSSNSKVRVKVRLEYRADLTETDLPTTAETLTLGFNVNYVQNDGTGSSVKDNGYVAFANSNINDIGTIVTIGSEQFYTIGTEGDNVKLLSMYNLHVGNELTFFDEETGEITMNAIANPTGMQSDSAKGCGYSIELDNFELPFVGITAFSSDEHKGSNYNDYNGSLVEEYVNSYKNKLEEKFRVNILEARLVTNDELTNSETFACVEGDSCSDKYPFVYSTSYWTGTSAWTLENIDFVWGVGASNNFVMTNYDLGYLLGVRPVIVIPKSEIAVDIKPVVNGSLDDIGTIVTIGTEKFYTIGTEGDNVKLLSMMNITLDDNPIQRLSAGKTVFSSEEKKE